MVLLPLFDGEQIRACSRCASIGLRSPVRERSHFYPRRHPQKARYDPHCRECAKRIAVAYQRETGCHRQYMRRRRAAVKNDPEALRAELERQREYNRRYRARHPDRTRASSKRYRRANRQKVRDLARIDKRIDDDVELLSSMRSGPPLAIEPYREWIERELRIGIRAQNLLGFFGDDAARRARKQLCDRLEISPRTLYRYRFELKSVAEGVVDHALARDGRLSLYDLYPERREAA